MNCAILVMAAGSGSRFNAIKQLAEINGELVINRQLKQLFALGKPIYLVLGAHSKTILEKIDNSLLKQVNLITNHDWQQGIGHSIATAVTAITQHDSSSTHGYEHLMITLLDQLRISQNDLTNLLEHAANKPKLITCCQYNQQLGVPAVFPQHYFAQLKQLSGDIGAKKIINQTELKQVIDMPEAAFDLDTQEQLRELRKTLC